MKTFHYMVTTTGNLMCNFIFEDKKSLDKWIETEVPKLKKEHKKLDFLVRPLPGLKVGDSCHVWGRPMMYLRLNDWLSGQSIATVLC